ncbi:efflux RND transporter periplasmic adaptor subunit [Pleionea sp. CnH1-48]|uniref:efflux RND transporter periplasmic adaptor subunit n=1 Tax=Pleionea sp. CnH1-48 TaxID=2954494 RepID=UPI0020981B01|nr:efflux RND transporter periplasmic adaptor subunit [Pleionea sp. CnH1-48]MCO7223381.1 efflux RND transporter periplasmic adaptor subunit [Pleionea sp. CnH1-48]
MTKATMITKSLATQLSFIFIAGWLTSLPAQAGGGHAHSAPEQHKEEKEPANVVTHYNDTTELFVEFPPLVVNKPSTFAAHFTQLKDFKPVLNGVLDIYLKTQEKTVARFRVREPARTGIFLPDVVPNKTGRFELQVKLTTEDFESVHHLGHISVYAKKTDAKIEHTANEGDVGYLKEQQWQNPFASVQVQNKALRPSLPGFGTVTAPLNEFTIIRAPEDGYYTAPRMITAGHSIAVNESLGSFVPRLGSNSDIGNLQLDIERAESKLKLAKADVVRQEKLYQKGSVSEKLLMEAKQEQTVASAELKTAKTRLAQQTGKHKAAGILLTSPLQGEVTQVFVHPGSYVLEGAPLFAIANKNMRWLNVQIPEKFGERVNETSGVWFKSSKQMVVLDTTNNASLVKINQQVTLPSRTVEVAIAYPTSQGPGLIGSRFPVNLFIGESKSVLAIPTSSVIDDNGQSVVYVQSEGESFERRVVTLGIKDTHWVEVISGVQNNERVVSKGAYYVKLATLGGDSLGHGHAH